MTEDKKRILFDGVAALEISSGSKSQMTSLLSSFSVTSSVLRRMAATNTPRSII